MSNDTITGTSGYDQLYGGVGNDTVYGLGDFDDIYGGSGDDTLFGGTSDMDWLYGGTGNDTLDVGDGLDDEAYGGAGDDTFLLSQGTNTYYGGDDADFFEVGIGSDVIFGGSGGNNQDTLSGATADDALDVTLTGSGAGTYSDDDGDSGSFSGIEAFELSAGADTVDGSATSGSITVFGLDGSDSITGGGGDDTIYGGAGTDTVAAGSGADLVYGGAGDDSISSQSTSSTETVSITTANYTDTSSGFTVTAQNVSGGALTSADVSNIGTFSGGFGADGTVSDSDSAVTEQTGYDKASGLSERLIVDFDVPTDTASFSFEHLYTSTYGEVGHWAVYDDGALVAEGDFSETTPGGGSGTVNITGVGDFDQLVLTGNLQTDGTDGSDYMVTDVSFERPSEAGDDTLFGGAGNDILIGGVGNDELSGGTGNDSIDGGAGDDQFSAGLGDDTVYGGSGNDVISDSDGAGGGTGNGNDVLYGGDGNDTITSNSTGADGESVDDRDILYGGGGDDSLISGERLDTVYGGTGDDNILTQNMSQTVYAGSGNDTISGDNEFNTADTDLIYAGDGNDLVYSGFSGTSNLSQGESIYGGDGDDTVYGGTANDTIHSGSGNDTVLSGDGDDTIFFGSGADIVYAGDGDDYIDDQAGNPGWTDSNTIYAGAGADTMWTGYGDDSVQGGTGDDYINVQWGNDVADGGDGNDVVTGEWGNDSLGGGAGNDVLSSTFGDDTLSGGTGNDSLFGGTGSDTLDGGSGNDTLDGGNDDDVLTGGAGDDTFVLSATGGADTITDFVTGADKLDLSALTDVGNGLTNQDGTVTADEVTVTGGGGSDQVLTFPNGESVSVPDGSVDTSSTAARFASLVAMGVPPCFAPETLITTSRGERRVEDLRIGDKILTADRGFQTLRWIGIRHIDFTDPKNLRAGKDRPVLIGKGALGDGLPLRDLIVSPQHRMVLSGAEVLRNFGSREVFAIAKALTGLPGIRVMKGKRSVRYYALLLDRHDVIFAEGAATESFRPGPVALASFTPAQRAQIFRIYPGLADSPDDALGPPARPITKRRLVEAMLNGALLSAV